MGSHATSAQLAQRQARREIQRTHMPPLHGSEELITAHDSSTTSDPLMMQCNASRNSKHPDNSHDDRQQRGDSKRVNHTDRGKFVTQEALRRKPAQAKAERQQQPPQEVTRREPAQPKGEGQPHPPQEAMRREPAQPKEERQQRQPKPKQVRRGQGPTRKEKREQRRKERAQKPSQQTAKGSVGATEVQTEESPIYVWHGNGPFDWSWYTEEYLDQIEITARQNCTAEQ